ncbi:MAG TPA: universal stress protein [Pseudomonas sp.]|nr:universal stress protein [Pseudomonas sp.]
MGHYHRLLTIVDLRQRHSPALQRAAVLAREGDAALHVMGCIEPPWSWPLLEREVRSKAQDGFVMEARQRLEAQAAPLRRQGLTVTAEPMWTADPFAEILRHVEELQPDMVIKDVERVGELRRTFTTPLDWHLLRDCAVPLHLVGKDGRAHPQRIAAAVDTSGDKNPDSSLNRRIVEAASILALQCDAELHLVHTCDPLKYLMGDFSGFSASWADLSNDLQASERSDFLQFADACGVPQSHRHFLLGPPTMTLADFAREQRMDVLVMGRVQRKGLDKRVGSTTEHVLYQVPCSILAIAPQE